MQPCRRHQCWLLSPGLCWPNSCWQQRVPRHMHVLLTVRNSRALSSSFSSRMRLNVGMTLLHVPDHAENTSTTARHEVAKCHVGRATPSGAAWSGAHVPRPHLSSLWTQAWPLATRRYQCYTARGAVLAPRPFLVCTAVNCNYAWRERCVMNVLRLRTQDVHARDPGKLAVWTWTLVMSGVSQMNMAQVPHE